MLGNLNLSSKEKVFPSPCLSVNIPLSERVAKSQAIVFGKVTNQKAMWDDEMRSIYTMNTIVVSEEWNTSGSIGSTIQILTEGGDFGAMGRTVIGALTLSLGDEGYFLLEKPRLTDATFIKQGVQQFHRIYADIQGMLAPTQKGNLKDCWGKTSFDRQSFSKSLSSSYHHIMYDDPKKELNLQVVPDKTDNVEEKVMASVSVEPLAVIGGKGETVTIKGSGFGASRGSNYVTFTNDGTNYHDADYARTFAYKKWTDTEIIVEVPPSYSGKVRVMIGSTKHESTEKLRVTANIATRSVNPLVYNQLVNRNDKGGYTWVLDKQLFDNKEARECTESVMRQFRCKTNMSFTLSDKPTTAGYKMNDGVNSIVFDAPGYELPDGTVAYCDWVWYSCVVGNQTFYYIPDFDCRLSTDFEWYYGKGKNPKFGMAKLRYALFHEIGHALQFGHVNEEGESMHPIVQALPAENWLERDTITESEQRAGTFFTKLNQSITFQGCGIKKLLPPQLNDCNIDLLAVNVVKSPSDTVICKGSDVELMVDAKPVPSDLTLQYQWLKDGQPIQEGNPYEGVNTSKLLIKRVDASLTGNYSVDISTNWTGVGSTSTVSQAGRLSLNIAPKVTFIPKERLEGCKGSTIDFSAGVYGKEFDYKLIRVSDNKDIPSPDSSSFSDSFGDSTTISYSLDISSSGKPTQPYYDLSYKFIASSSCGSDSSGLINIRVYEHDSIVNDLSKATEVQLGDTLKLSISAIGNDLTYQWFKNLKPISGARDAQLIIPNTKFTDNGQYFCIVNGFCNSDTSSFTTCTVKGAASSKDIHRDLSFSLSPNPASNQVIVTYQVSAASKSTIMIVDLTGKVIDTIDLGYRQEGIHHFTIPTAGLSNGMYTFILINQGNTLARQVTILK